MRRISQLDNPYHNEDTNEFILEVTQLLKSHLFKVFNHTQLAKLVLKSQVLATSVNKRDGFC